MTDDALREVYRRIAALLPDHGYYYVCVVVSDLSSEPFEHVWQACIEEDD